MGSPGVTIGIPNGPGLSVTSGVLVMAMVTPSATDHTAGDDRSWLALSATGLTGSLAAPGFQLFGTGFAVSVNQASGSESTNVGTVDATPIDWMKDVLDPTKGNAAETVAPGSPPQTISFAGKQLTASGSVGIDVGPGLADLSGGFSMTESTVSGSDGSISFSSVPAIEVDVSAAQGFVGLGGSLNGSHQVVPGTTGVSVSGGSVTVEEIKASSTVTYLGIAGSDLGGSSVGLSPISVTLSNGNVLVNQVSTGTTLLNWKNVTLTSGSLTALPRSTTRFRCRLVGRSRWRSAAS